MSEGGALFLAVCILVVTASQCATCTKVEGIRKDLHGIAREIDEAGKACGLKP